jgi:hypothetical protein
MTARTFSSIKTASRLVTGFAAAAIAFAPSQSFGQDLKPMPVANTSDGITAETNCKEWHPGELMGSEKCEILKGEFLKAQSRALDAQLKALGGTRAQLTDDLGCRRLIVSAAKLGKINLTSVPAPGQACKAAKSFGLT